MLSRFLSSQIVDIVKSVQKEILNLLQVIKITNSCGLLLTCANKFGIMYTAKDIIELI